MSSMEYLESQLVDGFRVSLQEHLSEAMNFAVSFQENEHGGTDQLRQAAQDALSELLPEIIPAIMQAYQRSPLRTVDFAAMSVLFKQLAIRAKLEEYHSSGELIGLVTRKGTHQGIIRSIREHEEQEQVELDNGMWVPLASVQGLA